MSGIDPHRPSTSVRRRLMVPLGLALLGLIGAYTVALFAVQRGHLRRINFLTTAAAASGLENELQEHFRSLQARGDELLTSANLRDALATEDRDRLLADTAALFLEMQGLHGITNFAFYLPNRANLLRVHDPQTWGDQVDRFTLREAERTGNASSGVELGPRGDFILRAVQPVFDGGELIGYLELGEDIEMLLRVVVDAHPIELVLLLNKEHLKRAKWEEGMRALGRVPDWDRYTDAVVSYSSLAEFPVEFDRFAGGGGTAFDVVGDAEIDDRTWHLQRMALIDAERDNVGNLLFLADVSADAAALQRTLAMAFVGGGALLIVLLGFLYVALGRVDENIESQHAELVASATEIGRSEARLRELTTRLREVREEEQTLLARELHDELGQSLTGVSMDLAWIARKLEQADPEVQERVGAATELVAETIGIVRRISSDLRPPALDDLGLFDAIRWYADGFAQRSGLAVNVEMPEAPSDTAPDAATAVFRVVQEALTNVARHADASEVRLVVDNADGVLDVRVIDNGRGIAVEESSGERSLGLLGMRERATAIGGKVTVARRPEGGTEVTMSAPLDPDTKGAGP